MSPTSSKKRKASSQLATNTKRSRAKQTVRRPGESEIITVEDSDEDVELNDILAQIKAQEDSERLAKQLQDEFHKQASSSNVRDVSFVDPTRSSQDDADAALAHKLAEEWAKEDNEFPIESVARHESSSTATISKSENGKAREPGHEYISDSSEKLHTGDLPLTKPDEALANHRSTFTKTRTCSNCSKNVKSPRGCVVFTHSSETTPPSMVYLLHAPCNSCKTNHCRGCFTRIACPPACKGPSNNPECTVLTCCAEVRAIAIFEILGGFDRQFLDERARSDSRALAMSKKKSKSKASGSVGPGGTGYGTGGRTSAANTWGAHTQQPPSSRTNRSTDNKKGKGTPSNSCSWDDVVIHVLDLLVQLLPSPYSSDPQPFDILPHESIGHLISPSQLPTLLATLLRNDSVTDWIAQKDVYNAMLSLLRRMADCELTIQCLIGQRWDIAASCGLEEWMWEDGEISFTKTSTGDPEILPPLYSHFTKLTRQSDAFLKGATQMLAEADDGDTTEMMIQGTSLCGDIIAARDDLERAIAILRQPSAGVSRVNRVDQDDITTHSRRTKNGKSRDFSIHVDKAYEEACEKLAFKYVSLAENAIVGAEGLVYANYNYTAQLSQTQTSTRNPKGRLHLLKELAVTATSLPPGVWVRVDEVRNDAIKIMIAGPEGTPYAGGLFEFDCFIPLEYPNTPPLFHLRTTGGGSVRFNPNLYNNGKVCLSLLGTWPGRPEEQWSPKSTLLQVLVSIQSMILIDAPYFNEPGHGQANVKAPVSIEYNRNIALQNVKWAIVDWLQDKHCSGIWRDVIKSHFLIRHEKIRQQIVDWSKTDPAIQSYTKQDQSYHHYPPPYNQSYDQPNTTTGRVDLLAEFDTGIQRIRNWETQKDWEE